MLTVFRAGGDDVNTGSVDGTVSQNIRQLGDVLIDAIEYPCEQVPQIVRKNLFRIDIRILAQLFHPARYWYG